MNYLFFDIYKKSHYRIAKDTAGGFGTANDLGNGVFGKTLSMIIKNTVSWPSLSFCQLLQQFVAAGHNCNYQRLYCSDRLPNLDNIDAVFICSSIVCFETELALTQRVSKNFQKPIFLCGNVVQHTEVEVPVNCIVLGGNYELTSIDHFQSQATLRDFIIEKNFSWVRTKKKLLTLSPIEWGLNGLPVPKKNIFLGGRKAFIPYIFSRGCPYSCAEYCTYPTSQGKQVFAPSIEKCMEDLTTISRRFPKSHVVFRDPVFSINLKLTKSLLDEIAKKDLGLEFSAELH